MSTPAVSDAILSPHVTPTHTVARRAAFPLATHASDAPMHVVHISPHGSNHGSASSRHQRRGGRAIM